MFRPGFIEPKAGIRSKTAFYRLFYLLARPARCDSLQLAQLPLKTPKHREAD